MREIGGGVRDEVRHALVCVRARAHAARLACGGWADQDRRALYNMKIV